MSSHLTIFSSRISRILSNEKRMCDVNLVMSKHLPQSHQGEWAEPTKFDELRIKTDIQLVQLVHAELELDARHARQTLQSADTWDIAEECHRRANRASAKVVGLIPLVAEFPAEQRNGVESQLARVQRMLDAPSGLG